MKLRFTKRAIENLADIADYIQAHDPSAARRVRSAIYGSLQNLMVFPDLGRLQATSGVRKLVTSRYKYLIYYSADRTRDEIIVLSVRHGAQQRGHSDA